MAYNAGMSTAVEEKVTVKEPPKFLNHSELYELLSRAESLDKQMFATRLSGKARRIIEAEAKRYGVDKTMALEFALRELQELTRRKKRI